jgi:hypothetical protein
MEMGIPSILENLLMMELLKQMITEDGLQEFSNHLVMLTGFSEELKEVTYAVGAEYLYQDSFAMRLGYFHRTCERCSTIFSLAQVSNTT